MAHPFGAFNRALLLLKSVAQAKGFAIFFPRAGTVIARDLGGALTLRIAEDVAGRQGPGSVALVYPPA